MSENPDLPPNATQADPFEVQMRGYSRRQVDEFVARSRNQARDLEERLSRSLDEVERLRLELSTARQTATSNKPAHEEVSERIAQILKLADDEATAQKTVATDEITKQRDDAQKAAEATRAEAKGQAERMLTAAQEQAERTVTAARTEAEQTRNTARAESEHAASAAKKNAETTIANAKAQAKQVLDEATARASAIHDGAERRLDLLKNRHSEAMRRLTEIRDVVTDLVTHDMAKGTLDEEVEKSVAATLGTSAGTAGAAAKASSAPATPAKAKTPTPATVAAAPSGQSSPAQSSAAQSSPAQSSAAQPASAAPATTAQSAASQSSGAAQHARHAATPADRSLRQAKPGTPAHGGGRPNGSVPEASPDDVRVIMP
jgi:cell division septum initiation protein DivIVA